MTGPGERPEWAVVLAAISYHPIVHVKIGPLSISPHGVGIAVGFLLGARLMLPSSRKKGITDDDVYALLQRAAVGAIVGARLAYVLNHLPSRAGETGYLHDPIAIFKIWEGGISLLGGFIGAILLALPEMRKRRLSFWKVMDAAAPGMALGVIIGRIGDLIVADHLGTPTHFFLGYRCPGPFVQTASACNGGTIGVVHQTALYDLILTVILIGGLLALRRTPRYDGFLITVFGVWYGMQRVIEDFLREDVKHDIFGVRLTGSQITAIITMVLCLWHLATVRRTPRWGRWDERGLAAAEPGTELESGREADVEPGAPAAADDEVRIPDSPPAPPTMAPPEQPDPGE